MSPLESLRTAKELGLVPVAYEIVDFSIEAAENLLLKIRSGYVLMDRKQ